MAASPEALQYWNDIVKAFVGYSNQERPERGMLLSLMAMQDSGVPATAITEVLQNLLEWVEFIPPLRTLLNQFRNRLEVAEGEGRLSSSLVVSNLQWITQEVLTLQVPDKLQTVFLASVHGLATHFFTELGDIGNERWPWTLTNNQ